MRTGVAQGKDLASALAAEDQRNSQKHGGAHSAAAYPVAAQRGIPEAVEPVAPAKVIAHESNIQARAQLAVQSRAVPKIGVERARLQTESFRKPNGEIALSGPW